MFAGGKQYPLFAQQRVPGTKDSYGGELKNIIAKLEEGFAIFLRPARQPFVQMVELVLGIENFINSCCMPLGQVR